MDIIDNEGRLFGWANVLDILVLLFVIAVAVAGLAIAAPFDNGETVANRTQNQYGIVRFETSAGETAGLIEPGDTIQTIGKGKDATALKVTDVYRTPLKDGRSAVVALVSVQGDPSETMLKVGQHRQFTGSDYQLNGTISAVRQRNGTLPVTTTNVTVKTTLSPDLLHVIEVGDEYRIGGDSVARIDELHITPTTNERVQARMRLALKTRLRNGNAWFGEKKLRIGRSIPFKSSQYGLTGVVTDIGTPSIAGQQRTTSVRLRSRVPASTARSITPGDRYEFGGQTIASVDSVSVFPTNESNRKRIRLTASLQTTQRRGETLFLGQRVATGSSLRFQTNQYSLNGTVLRQSDHVDDPTTTTRHATVRVENVSPAVADAITVGATERQRNETYVTVQSKRTAPATVIITTDSGQMYRREHPVNKDVTLGVDLTVSNTPSGLQFHGEPLQTGQQVVFAFRSVTVEGTVQSVGDR